MHLKKIELFGFKSFADKTEITFERGVTCVVGPNGCGKSNISDSIRWVLGERSAKLLRGSKMEDVIFSGTDFRKPLNLSEVSLTIDNADQKLPIQYEEVVITRRLYRSGESEYLINKTPCRLKDIQDLILDTGIGSNSYSMIEQGRIDYILNAEAEERRFLIEEAAGISKYKVKKEEALRKLERTEENLLRLNDITSEVERNIRYAERQAQRAERYKDQFERLKRLETQKAFFELHAIDDRLTLLEHERKEHDVSLAIFEEEASRENAIARELDARLRELEQTFLEQESARSEVKQELVSLENYENFHREKIEFLKLNSEKALGEIESLTQRWEHLKAEIKHKQQEREGLADRIRELQNEKTKKELSLSNSSGPASEADQNSINHEQALLFDLARQISDIKNALNKNQIELVSLERAQSVLKDSRTKSTETKQLLTQRLRTTTKERSDYEVQLAEKRDGLAVFLKQKENLEALFESNRKEMENLKAQKAKLESQFLLFEELDNVDGSDPRKIIAEHGSHPAQLGMMTTLLDLIDIEPGYELATEAALQNSLQAVVTENMDTAVQLFTQLKQRGSHRATIFIKDRAVLNGSLVKDPEAEQHPLVQKRLWDVISIQKGYDAIFGNLLGKVYIVDEITSENVAKLAKLAERVKLVSKSGAIFGPEFQIVLRNGGYVPERSTLARKKEVKRLQSEITKLNFEEETLDKSLKEKALSIHVAKESEKGLRQAIIEYQVASERAGTAGSNLTEQAQQIESELQLLDREERQNNIEIEQLTAEKENLTAQLNSLEAQEVQVKNRFEFLKNQISSEKTAREITEHDLANLASKLELQLEKANDLEQTGAFLEHQLKDNTSRIQALNTERQGSFVQIDKLKAELETFGTKRERVNQLLIERSVETEKVKRERNELISKRNQALEKTHLTVKTIDELKQKFHQYSLKEMELNHQKDSIKQNLHSRYKISLTELNSADYPLSAESLEEVRSEIERLSEKIDSIGTVNLLAIEEYQELKGRYEFLLNQRRDLTEARDSLLEAIRKINRTTKKLFEETLARVREYFREYFRALFGGGQADLILLDEINPIDSGIDIIARPPGKKLQHISLLSGGEKALTAGALLLALFSVKPSPFCVLDEVDAPLDEANNERFLTVLKPFLASTQFIIVTHSRKTIAMGDALYGVTMQEPGVSKIVSVRLSSERDEIEHADQKIASELNQILD